MIKQIWVLLLTLSPCLFSCEKYGNPINAQSGPAEPPVNKYLANSPWPLMHRNNYAQASTFLAGPKPGDNLSVQTIDLKGRVSPWLYFSEKYPDGSRAIWSSTTTAITKTLSTANGLKNVSTYSITKEWFNFSPWGHILLKGNDLFVSDGKILYILGDEVAGKPDAAIKIKKQFALPASVNGKAALFNITYDGWIVFNTDKGMVGAVSPGFNELKTYQVPLDKGEIAWHNQFAIDEEGGIFIVTTKKMVRINWKNNELSLGWQAAYDFVKDGPTSTLPGGQSIAGSGTTPTLMGWGKMDKLVIVVDGHNKANMVAFWRDGLPGDWKGLTGYDKRIAAVTALPYAKYLNQGNALVDYQAVENSPCARGYEIACAQYNGFNQQCEPVNGVQKLVWSPETRKLNIAWSTNAVNLNNVLTYSEGAGLIYGTGRKNCNYFFYGLDWKTGEIKIEKLLGRSDDFNDQGCGNQVAEDGTLIYSGAKGIVAIKPQGR
jgi:hypothetical protein